MFSIPRWEHCTCRSYPEITRCTHYESGRRVRYKRGGKKAPFQFEGGQTYTVTAMAVEKKKTKTDCAWKNVIFFITLFLYFVFIIAYLLTSAMFEFYVYISRKRIFSYRNRHVNIEAGKRRCIKFKLVKRRLTRETTKIMSRLLK